MKISRRIMMAAAAVLMMGATSAKADLVFATDAAPYPPFTSQNAAGEWEGWEYDLLQALCAEMKEKCTLIPIAWDGIIPALLEKKMDGIFGSMSISDERGRVFGGHVGYGNEVRTSAEVLLMWLSDFHLAREFDPHTGFKELVVRRRE